MGVALYKFSVPIYIHYTYVLYVYKLCILDYLWLSLATINVLLCDISVVFPILGYILYILVVIALLHDMRVGHINDVLVYMQCWRKVEQPEGAPWPVGRCSHAAACIGQDDPHLLISGGLDKAYRSLSDVWLYGLGTGRWREVSMSVVCTVTYYVYWWGCQVLGVRSVQYNVLFNALPVNHLLSPENV